MEKFKIETLQQAAKSNDTFAINTLAAYYIEGDEVEQNYEEALRLLRQIGAMDSALAKLLCARIYFDERYAGYDRAKAEQYVFESARMGNVRGMYLHGLTLCEEGRSKSDSIEGVRWIRTAADLGEIKAQKILEEEILPDATKMADGALADLYAAAEVGDTEALNALARKHLDEESDMFDYEKAYLFIKKAWAQESVEAAFLLSELYHINGSPFQDEFASDIFLRYAVEHGHVQAMEALAIATNGNESEKLFRKAADLGGELAPNFIHL